MTAKRYVLSRFPDSKWVNKRLVLHPRRYNEDFKSWKEAATHITESLRIYAVHSFKSYGLETDLQKRGRSFVLPDGSRVRDEFRFNIKLAEIAIQQQEIFWALQSMDG